MKHLYRSNTNKVWAGVIGGLGEYMEVDPTVFRIIFIVITVFSGIVPGVLCYIVALLIVPTPTHVVMVPPVVPVSPTPPPAAPVSSTPAQQPATPSPENSDIK